MSIDAIVDYVEHFEDGSGVLHLVPADSKRAPAGQEALSYDNGPHDVTALNGRHIWGGSSEIMVGEKKIAKRVGYTKIQFVIDNFNGVSFK